MAVRRSIMDSLAEIDDKPEAPAATEATAEAPAVATAPEDSPSTPEAEKPAKRRSRARKARGEGDAGRSGARRPATRKPATDESTEPAGADSAKSSTSAPAAPRVLVPSTTDAKRVTLYLHADDFRALGLAKVDDSADINARTRAMIALWRANPRYRAAVDKLARTTSRGYTRG